jgi:hypothetical protein
MSSVVGVGRHARLRSLLRGVSPLLPLVLFTSCHVGPGRDHKILDARYVVHGPELFNGRLDEVGSWNVIMS